MIREKTHPCASVISVFFDKITPNGIYVALRSVGEFSHVLFQAHWALSCLPQISQICTDAFHVQSAIDPCSSVAPGRIKDQAVGSGARVKDP